MLKNSVLILLSLATLSLAKVNSLTGDKISSNADIIFSEILTDSGYSILTKSTNLVEHGERLFDHYILNPAKKSKVNFIEFVEKGGNLLVLLDDSAASRQVAKEFGVLLQKEEVVDLFDNEFKADGKVLKKNLKGISGLGMKLDEGLSNLVFPVLSCSETCMLKDGAFTADSVGQSLALIAAVQARNGARVLLAPKKFFEDFKTNKEILKDLLSWLFQERLVLRVISTVDRKLSEPKTVTGRDWYRIKDDFYYGISIQEYSDGNWKPFVLPKGDLIQFEAVMLDPYLRLNLQQSNKTAGLYEVESKFPDQHGVFTLKVFYMRHGYNFIQEKKVISLRQFRHNEYDRWLTSAYPYYTGAWSMAAAFVLFSVTFLFFKDEQKKQK